MVVSRLHFYYAGAGLAATFILLLLCPLLDQVSQQLEDKRFVEYLRKEVATMLMNSTHTPEKNCQRGKRRNALLNCTVDDVTAVFKE